MMQSRKTWYGAAIDPRDIVFKEDFELEALGLDEAQEILGVDFNTDD